MSRVKNPQAIYVKCENMNQNNRTERTSNYKQCSITTVMLFVVAAGQICPASIRHELSILPVCNVSRGTQTMEAYTTFIALLTRSVIAMCATAEFGERFILLHCIM